MKISDSKLPVFMHDPITNKILREAASAIPKGTRVYIVGGAGRNAVYYKLFRKSLPQRDYDLLVMGDLKKFIANLRKIGFTYGKIIRKDEIVVKKKRIPKPEHIHRDYLYLDAHASNGKTIIDNLKKESSFTFSSFAINLKDVNSKNWYKNMVSLPTALTDIRAKRIRVNSLSHPALLYSTLRFMSLGFKPPPKTEVQLLLKHLGKLPKKRFDRNMDKIFDYVGGENKARKLAKKLGVKEDIFNWKTIEKLRRASK